MQVEVLLVLQVEIKTTNEQLQKSGLSLMAKGQELVTYRKIERNIDSAIETLNLCLPGESICPRHLDMSVIVLPAYICLLLSYRALYRITLLPVTHVLVDTWMLTGKPVYKLLNVSDDLKWTTNTHVTLFSLTFKAQLTISMVLEDFFADCGSPRHLHLSVAVQSTYTCLLLS